MKEIDPIVLHQEDIEEMLKEVISNHSAKWLTPRLMSILKINNINNVHARNCHFRGPAFAHAILKDEDINVSYKLHGAEHLDNIPDGAFFSVSNHPFGGLDGIMLLDILGQRRADYKMLVNSFLSKIGAMNDSFIPTHPLMRHREDKYDPSKNISGVMQVKTRISEGHPIGLFPAGGISRWSWKRFQIVEQLWKPSAIRLIRAANVPVLPVYFEGRNSLLYNIFGMINLKMQVVRIPCEIFNKKGKTISIHIRPVIEPSEWQYIESDTELAKFFHDKTVHSST
ncbi:hypothetical protein HQ39_07420 [Porphyromonas sp. COT-108 OH2963]|uniref:1-acyl-sn-glycerol-3-phosphate acyltransferase n=1 Tax=Porphyromonas sp. COT-108 OH2963 TaxID=1515614 RepID=UPI00052C3F9E|nr:1-acyl-sn-glycerol-3-phosphate acyltransferase [Porphyromonas sp. COT-108 OH2963]KGN94755.1 hypothetical protein HQ39_07420 [Porphyromonas sp. COT-108 OH2963]